MTVAPNKLKRLALGLGLGALMLFGGVFSYAMLEASGVSTTLYAVVLNTTNTGSTDLDDIQIGFNVSAATLIDGNFIESDALNALLHKGITDIPGMPPSGRIQIEGAVQDDGGAFTEYTTAAQNTTTNDVQVIPAAAAVNDAVYFGCDNPCRIVTFDISQAGVGTWTITYEYWDGDSYEALTNVADRTTNFTTLGRNTVSWDMPTDWVTQTVTGSSVNSFWGRGRVSAFTSETTQPLASQVFYENGQWWTWVEDLDVNNQEQFTIYLGGSDDIVTAHQIFPGAAGIVTPDNATIEVTGSYSVGVIGRFDFSAAGASTCVLCKTGAVTISVSGASSSPVIGTSFTGSTNNVAGDLTGITMPDTGAQTLIVASDGTNAATFFGATTGGMFSHSVAGIYTDNANNLTWASNGGIDYLESIRIDTAAPTIFNFSTSYSDFNSGTQTNTQAYTGVLGLGNQ